jgi:hypothetical protein
VALLFLKKHARRRAVYERPGPARIPGGDRVLGLQIGRQHDDEDDQKHMRDAGAVGHGRHIAAPGPLGELVGEVGVKQVAERQGDAERRQDAAEDRGGRQLHHAEA